AVGAGHESANRAVLLVAVFKEEADVGSQIVVQASEPLLIAEGAAEIASQTAERRYRLHRSEQILLCTLARSKHEQLVLDDRTTEAHTVLLAVENGGWIAKLR